MRLLMTGGGTGGHVYPAFSVLEAWEPRPEVLWIGKTGGLEEPLVKRMGISYRAISAGGLRSMAWHARLGNTLKLMRGFGEARHIVGEFRPDVVFATGGYVTFPVGLVAWLQRIPVAIYLPDIVPGLAVRALAPLARNVAVTTPETKKWFGEKAIVTGYPVRQDLVHPKSKEEARRTFDIPPESKVLLVTGGSQGSHSLNEAVGLFLPEYLKLAHLIHVHGKSDGEWLVQQRAVLPPELRDRYLLYEYLHETMIDALLAADLVVARGGASVLGEFPAAGLPAILVPFPIRGVNQQDNAEWLESRGGAITLNDEGVRMELLPLVRELLTDAERLRRMERAMQEIARPDAAANIVAMLRALASNAGQPLQQKRQPNG
ncbi:MAG: undecaprenyldiphospho-muramoylpentapeptide beta-N-acetylglucosaminyltransferase [Chloroflexota bacterium]|nr:undecaprenyldiphospho-muramoylpentapeptide beta-N-acetylglucosaminyltransferase [Chloroflexota bacterium]